MFYFLLGAGLVFDFLNGFHDSSNIVATVISSRALRPRAALLMTAIAEFVAPFLFGVAIASTIGRDLLLLEAISFNVILAAILSAILWNLLTWYLGVPSSSSHALVGGLIGAAIVSDGFQAIQPLGLMKILIALFISPPLGLLVGWLFMHFILAVFRNATPRINLLFKRSQILTSLALALSHGTNDSQKTMGVITLGLVIGGYQETFHVPTWVIAISAGAIALGTAFGGWRLIRTLGGRIYKVRPVHAFSSQAASALVILSAALLGGPVSTTHVISSAIMGTGAAERLSKVRWQIALDMLTAWILTIPLCGVASALLYLLLSRLFVFR